MIVPLVLFAVFLYHWYEMVPPSGDVAATVNVTEPFLATVVLASGCVPITGVTAFTSAFTVTLATELVCALT
jgi:hypothetical protein